ELYEKKKSLVKSKDIALKTGRDEGTIRNIMPVLRALGLVEAVPGPKGGYMPTSKAYESFSIPKQFRTLTVPIYSRSGENAGVTVTDILFKSVYSPDFCQVLLKVVGDVSKLDIGEELVVGPTPSGRMVIEGKIVGRDEIHGEILLEVINIVSIPKERVRNLMSKRLVSVPPNISVKEAAGILYREFIRAAPVIDGTSLVGMITGSDVARCASEDKLHQMVSEATSRRPVTIGMDEDILEAMNKMRRSSIGRLVVVDDQNRPVGIITRTDLLSRMLKPFEMVETVQK
ncbi:MAG: CBS domain-containing protein, partial [Candidatus Methanomethyliales bacterium]|nr:CBS domain-containing protein [Candidatus Methanomethylicales archaeon]